MRATQHQISMALALPIAVVAVWIASGEPAEPAVREHATAYRVELAELALPTPERLRPPGEITESQSRRVIPEEPTTRRHRPLLPQVSAPPPIDPPVDASPEIEVVASRFPHAAQETRAAVPSAPRPAFVDPLAAIAAASPPAPQRTPAVRTNVAREETDVGALPTQKPTTTVQAFASTPVRVATPGLAQRDTAPLGSRAPQSFAPTPAPDSAKGYSKPAPIVTDRIALDERPLEKFEKAYGHAPLTPPGQAKDKAIDLSLQDHAFEAPAKLIDLPLSALGKAAAPKFSDLKEEATAPIPGFRWLDSPPTVLLIIPEPGSALLLGAAIAALAAARRQQRRA